MISIFCTNPRRCIPSTTKLEDVSWLAAAKPQKKTNIKGPRLVTVAANTTRAVLACWFQRDGCAHVILITQRRSAREVGTASIPHWWPVNLENVAKSLDPMQTRGTIRDHGTGRH
jgi:hypothetical protein